MGLRGYHLYRVKFIKSFQLSLFSQDKSSSELFIDTINEKPALILTTGVEWHIGNIEYFDNHTGSFAVGKTTKKTVEKFDEVSGNFIDSVDDSGPYTTVVFDCSIGLLGISMKSQLAPKASTIARKIKKLFEQTRTAIESEIDIRVDFIPDPDDFIEKLKGAYSIKKFKATFTGPNPVDADELFQKPLSVYAQKMGAEKGTLEVQGNALDEEVAEIIAKSTAATGNTATALILRDEGSKAIHIKMKKTAIIVNVDEDATPREALLQLQEQYVRVRG